jgi:hypothetical protein
MKSIIDIVGRNQTSDTARICGVIRNKDPESTLENPSVFRHNLSINRRARIWQCHCSFRDGCSSPAESSTQSIPPRDTVIFSSCSILAYSNRTQRKSRFLRHWPSNDHRLIWEKSPYRDAASKREIVGVQVEILRETSSSKPNIMVVVIGEFSIWITSLCSADRYQAAAGREIRLEGLARTRSTQIGLPFPPSAGAWPIGHQGQRRDWTRRAISRPRIERERNRKHESNWTKNNKKKLP